jgi:hypothetical protein
MIRKEHYRIRVPHQSIFLDKDSTIQMGFIDLIIPTWLASISNSLVKCYSMYFHLTSHLDKLCSLYLLTIEHTSQKSYFHIQLSSLLSSPQLTLRVGPTILSLPLLLLAVHGDRTARAPNR